MPLSFSKLASALLLTGTLVGCAAVVKTPYQAPSVSIPESFQNSKVLSQQLHAAVNTDQWWTLFNDLQLNQLVQQVLANNNDLAVAGINLQQARLQAGLIQNKQGPRVNSSVSTGHSIDLNSGDDASRGLSVSAGVSYELDLFGKLARQTEASQWEARATAQDLQSTAQSLIATTTTLYWQLGYLNERYQIAQQNLASTQKTYDLVRVQYRAGAVSGLDLTSAEQAVQGQKASLSQIEQQRVETRSALAV